MGKKSGLFLLCGAVLLFCLYAVRISYPAGTSGFPEVQAVTEVRTYDSLKKPVTVSFSKIPERVIINRLNGAETLMALGAADRIVAVNMQNTESDQRRSCHFKSGLYYRMVLHFYRQKAGND